MSKSNTTENNLLLLVFNNTNWANIGDATGLRGSTTAGNFFWTLHTADPAEAGTQSTSEVSYTGYARVSQARSGAGFTVSGNTVNPAANVDFGQRSDVGTTTATHAGVGAQTSGANELLYRFALTPNITIAQNTIPRVLATSSITED